MIIFAWRPIELAKSNNFRDGIQSVRDTTYTVKSAANLYPTAGTSDDYAYSRDFVDSTKENVMWSCWLLRFFNKQARH